MEDVRGEGKKRDDAKEEEGKGKVSGNTRGRREEEKIEKQKSEVDDER